jgi:hypothetical protein
MRLTATSGNHFLLLATDFDNLTTPFKATEELWLEGQQWGVDFDSLNSSN